MGADGAYITDGSVSLKAERIDVPVGSTVGAGDAMLGGLVAGFRRGLSLNDTFAWGVACATNAVMGRGTGLIDPSTCADLFTRVHITRI